MRIVYICSPYRAADEETLHRNIEYARELTREALLRGESPVTVHLYMTQCLNETDRQERETGLAAGREIIPRSVDESNLVAEDTDAATAIKDWFSKVQEAPDAAA